jgi:DNA primase
MSGRIDFAVVRHEAKIQALLTRMGIWQYFKARGNEHRGPCPFHVDSDTRSKPMSVNVAKNTYYCFCPRCKKGGNVIDFYARLMGVQPYIAAQRLADYFQIDAYDRAEERQPVEPVSDIPVT